jgi:small-conductance mechanosensitive channel
MAIPPIAPAHGSVRRPRIFDSARAVTLLALFALLVLCVVFSWTTRDAMQNLSFLKNKNGSGGSALVDLGPWQTAQALAPLAVTAEETEYARDAERLADHEVDQAFATALRLSGLQQRHRTLTGAALQMSQKVEQLKLLIQQDQALVDSLSAKTGPSGNAKNSAPADANGDDLDVAKAQLELDSDELADAQLDLQRESGDKSAQIQSELAAHEASMRQYDSQSHDDGQIAAIVEKKHGTLAERLVAWFSQNSRRQSIQQAIQEAQDDAHALTAEHDALEAKANAALAAAPANATDRAARLADIKDRAAERQVLSIYDDRIQTIQQLAVVYGKWSAQVQLQHRIVLHLILQSFALIIFIVLCMVLFDAFVRRLMTRPSFDNRQSQTLRSILELGIQVLGLVLILLVVFGTPEQTPTILGLTTAALTFALQDFILAFLGWFVLVGKHGMHVGDWVEINGVGGEVTEIGLFRTTLLETGTLVGKGHPTGRHTTFMNGFAIRGQYFNFSTTGQWMWDEITVSLPATDDIHTAVDNIDKMVLKETEENTRIAEEEWKRGTRGDGLSRFSATPVVNLRPTAAGIDLNVRYVTRASERFDVRNRLYQDLVDLLHEPPKANPSDESQPSPGA